MRERKSITVINSLWSLLSSPGYDDEFSHTCLTHSKVLKLSLRCASHAARRSFPSVSSFQSATSLATIAGAPPLGSSRRLPMRTMKLNKHPIKLTVYKLMKVVAPWPHFFFQKPLQIVSNAYSILPYSTRDPRIPSRFPYDSIPTTPRDPCPPPGRVIGTELSADHRQSRPARSPGTCGGALRPLGQLHPEVVDVAVEARGHGPARPDGRG